MLRVALALLIATTTLPVLGGAAEAQPTFGRPKGKGKPATPSPSPDDAPRELENGDSPSMPDAESSTEFVPSPDAWAGSDPAQKKPARDVEPGKTYTWRSADGLRFAYTIPIDYKSGEGYDIVVVCHPNASDFRWGMVNHAPGKPEPDAKAAPSASDISRMFRPHAIVVSVDGPGAHPKMPDRRSFPCTQAAAVRFRDFLLELSRTMPGNRICLYGYGGGGDPENGGAGGTFVAYFSGVFPNLADGGVVAYGGGELTSEAAKPIQTYVPAVYIHGVKNTIVPFSSALRAIEAHRSIGNRLVRLRALRAFNDYPNPVRVSESIDYLIGARTDKAAECLASVEALLTPKSVDEYDYAAPVWYAGARELLARILNEPGPLTGAMPFEGDAVPTDEVKTRARALISLIDAEATKHIGVIRETLPKGTKATDLYLDGGPWLGHLIAARDDFRGVKPMDDFAKELGLDEAIASHALIAETLQEAWSPTDEVSSFAAAIEHIPHCFLSEGLPVDLLARMKGWKRKALGAELALDPESLEGYENITNWDDGYRKGLDAYEKVWRGWRFEGKSLTVP